MRKSIRTSLNGSLVVAAALIGLTPITAGAAQAASTVRYETVLKSTPAFELPARAASLVQAAEPNQRESVALAVLQAVSKLNPPAVPAVVAAVCRVEPSLAPKLTTEAAKLQPKLAEEIRLAALTPSSTIRGEKKEKGPPEPVGPPEPSPGRGKKKGHYKNP